MACLGREHTGLASNEYEPQARLGSQNACVIHQVAGWEIVVLSATISNAEEVQRVITESSVEYLQIQKRVDSLQPLRRNQASTSDIRGVVNDLSLKIV
jgi:hypothetical protein